MMAAAAARRAASRWFSDSNVRLSTTVLGSVFITYLAWSVFGPPPTQLAASVPVAFGYWFNAVSRASGKEEQVTAETATRAEDKADRAGVKAERADAKAEQADAKAAGAKDTAVTALGAARRAGNGATGAPEGLTDDD